MSTSSPAKHGRMQLHVLGECGQLAGVVSVIALLQTNVRMRL